MAASNNESELKTSWSTTTPWGFIKRTLPVVSVSSGPRDVSAPIIVVARRMTITRVPRSSRIVLTLCKNRPSQEKIVFNAFTEISYWVRPKSNTNSPPSMVHRGRINKVLGCPREEPLRTCKSAPS